MALKASTAGGRSPAAFAFQHKESECELQARYWSHLLLPYPGNLPDQRIKPESLVSPALAEGFFTTASPWKSIVLNRGKLDKGICISFLLLSQIVTN